MAQDEHAQLDGTRLHSLNTAQFAIDVRAKLATEEDALYSSLNRRSTALASDSDRDVDLLLTHITQLRQQLLQSTVNEHAVRDENARLQERLRSLKDQMENTQQTLQSALNERPAILSSLTARSNADKQTVSVSTTADTKVLLHALPNATTVVATTTTAAAPAMAATTVTVHATGDCHNEQCAAEKVRLQRQISQIQSQLQAEITVRQQQARIIQKQTERWHALKQVMQKKQQEILQQQSSTPSGGMAVGVKLSSVPSSTPATTPPLSIVSAPAAAVTSKSNNTHNPAAATLQPARGQLQPRASQPRRAVG